MMQVQRLRQIVRERGDELIRERQHREWDRNVAHGMEGNVWFSGSAYQYVMLCLILLLYTSRHNMCVCTHVLRRSKKGNRSFVARISRFAVATEQSHHSTATGS